MELISYEIDRDDRIVLVDDEWSVFARANGAPSLAGDAVLGTLLWDHIADPGTRWLYAEIVGRVRTSWTSFTFRFRCDAPDLRRFMQMDIVPAGEGRVCFASRIERLEHRVAVESPLRLPPDQELARICSWCQRVERCGRWRVIEAVIAEMEWLTDRAPRPFTHGICPECAALMADALKS